MELIEAKKKNQSILETYVQLIAQILEEWELELVVVLHKSVAKQEVPNRLVPDKEHRQLAVQYGLGVVQE